MLRLIVAFMANFDMNYRCDTYINIICAGYLIAVHCISEHCNAGMFCISVYRVAGGGCEGCMTCIFHQDCRQCQMLRIQAHIILIILNIIIISIIFKDIMYTLVKRAKKLFNTILLFFPILFKVLRFERI